MKCREEIHINGRTYRPELSTLHVFLDDNNECVCGKEQWTDGS